MSSFQDRLAKYKGSGQSNQKFDKTDYKALYWKPSIGEQTVRIVPAIWSKEDPTKMIKIHQWKVFKKMVYALTNFGEKDPAIDYMKELYEEKDDPECLKVARAIRPTDTFFVPVIVRGEEEKGVRLWKYTSKDTDEKLLTILSNEKKWGRVFDISAGRDLEITGYEVEKSMGGKKPLKYIAVDIEPSLDKTPLSDDPKLVEKWLKEQKDPIDLTKKYSAAEIKEMLRAYLFPEEDAPAVTDEVVTGTEADDAAPFTPDTEETGETGETEDTEVVEEEETPPPPVVKKPAARTTKAAATIKTPVVKKTTAEAAKPAPQAAAKTTVKGNATKTKLSVADKFDSLFND